MLRRFISTLCAFLLVGLWASADLRSDKTSKEPIVRVVLLEAADSFSLELRAPYTLTELDKGTLLARGDSVAKMDVVPDKKGIRFGTSLIPAKKVTLTARTAVPVQVNGVKYPGALDVILKNDERLLVVNRVPLEAYVEGVVAAEIGADAPQAALEAQAIAARTYACARIEDERQTRAKMYFDLYPDTRSQVYKGIINTGTNVPKAVAATRGRILTYKGRLFTTYFHSTCGGHTESVKNVFASTEIPPLAGVKCTWCKGSQYSNWKFKLSSKTIIEKLKQRKQKVGTIQKIEIDNITPSGRVGQVKIWHSRKETPFRLSGKEFRDMFGENNIRSTCFTVTALPDGFAIEGQGWGHGVGMCQVGARRMAEKGKKLAEIIQLYYPQAEITRKY